MVRVLVAIRESQGQRPSDFSRLPDGELLRWDFACDRDRDNIDGGCGCRRSLAGVVSRRATTTFKVAEIDGDDATVHSPSGLWTRQRQSRRRLLRIPLQRRE